jgi:hypothetical protein
MSASAAVAKASPALAAVPFFAMPSFDPVWAVVIPLGLTAAAMARLATMVDDTEPWKRIRADLFKSVMIAGGNAITASVIINVAHLDYLLGLGVAFGCGFGGVDALRGFWSRAMRAWIWLKGHALEDVGRERQQSQIDTAVAELVRKHELERLAAKLDRQIEKDGTVP